MGSESGGSWSDLSAGKGLPGGLAGQQRLRGSYGAAGPAAIRMPPSTFRAAGGMRRGNMGHLTRIANAVVRSLERGPAQTPVSEAVRGEPCCGSGRPGPPRLLPGQRLPHGYWAVGLPSRGGPWGWAWAPEPRRLHGSPRRTSMLESRPWWLLSERSRPCPAQPRLRPGPAPCPPPWGFLRIML